HREEGPVFGRELLAVLAEEALHGAAVGAPENRRADEHRVERVEGAPGREACSRGNLDRVPFHAQRCRDVFRDPGGVTVAGRIDDEQASHGRVHEQAPCQDAIALVPPGGPRRAARELRRRDHRAQGLRRSSRSGQRREPSASWLTISGGLSRSMRTRTVVYRPGATTTGKGAALTIRAGTGRSTHAGSRGARLFGENAARRASLANGGAHG